MSQAGHEVPAGPAQVSPAALARFGDTIAGLRDSELVRGLAVRASFCAEDVSDPDNREALRAISDPLDDRDGRQEWMLKELVRVDSLASSLRRGGREELARLRGRVEARPGALQRMLDALVLDRPVDVDRLEEDELVAALHVGRWFTTASALAGMPGLAGSFDREQLEGRVAIIETLRPLKEITQDGVVGRERELQRLRDFVVDDGRHLNLYDRRPFLVHGVGGVGKSTLVARFLLDLTEAPDPVAWAYVDLDRPSLASYDPMDVLSEVIRQVGAQFPEVRRHLDYGRREVWESHQGAGLESVDHESWRRLVTQLARSVGTAGGRLVVVLDTYEELERADAVEDRGSGAELDRMFYLLSEEVPGFRLIVAGRAPATIFTGLPWVPPARSSHRLQVTAFHGDDAAGVLGHLYEQERTRLSAGRSGAKTAPPLDPALAAQVVDVVGGSPLSLRIAAKVLVLEGAAGLGDAAVRARTVDLVADEVVQGFLYHRILGHIKGTRPEGRETLRDVARASLAVRHLTVDLVHDVLLPAIGRPDLDAVPILDGLLAETALVDREAGTPRLRDELRGPALLALRHIDPELVVDVHRRAVRYYEERPQLPGGAVEAVYHRLALGDVDGLADLGTRSADLERSLPDLPPVSRDLVARALRAPEELEETLSARARERETEASAQRALISGDLEEAAAVLRGAESWSPTTRLHRVVAQLEEARGDHGAAVAALRRDLAATLAAEDPKDHSTAAIRLALLLERAGSTETAFAVLTEADGQPWMGGHVLLRLELQLNRLAVLERSAGDVWPVDRWVLELDARGMLQRADVLAVHRTNALVRLLAATLGREERDLVLHAVRSIGLGVASDPDLIRDLAVALGQWDARGGEPGAVARSVGLAPSGSATADALAGHWLQALAGLRSFDTIPLLDKAFSLAPPDTAVHEALRAIYLWWDMAPRSTVPEPAHPAHVLPDDPLDVGEADAGRLIGVLTGAYPDHGDRQLLAARAGLDVEALDATTTAGLSMRGVLEAAAHEGRLPRLLGVVLADRKAADFHDEIRAVIGPEWLARNGIVRDG